MMSLSTHASYAVGLIVLAIAAAAPLLLPHGFLLYMLSLSMIGAIIATLPKLTSGPKPRFGRTGVAEFVFR